MEILELLPFLGILLLQFFYQLYKNFKRKSSIKNSSPTNSSYTSPLDEIDKKEHNEDEVSTSSIQYQNSEYDDAYTFSETPTTSSESQTNKEVSKSGYSSLLNELLGNLSNSNNKQTVSNKTEVRSDDNQKNKNENYYKAEEYHKETSVTHTNKERNNKNLYSLNSKSSSAYKLFKRMQKKDNLKDYWKAKFILDSPVGFEVNSFKRNK